VQPPSVTELKSHIQVTNCHFTPEILISALGDLTISNLAHTTRLRDCQRPTFVVRIKISFTSLFFILGGKFAYVRLLSFIVLREEYFIYPTPFRD